MKIFYFIIVFLMTRTSTTTSKTKEVTPTTIAKKVCNEVEKKNSTFQTLVTGLLIFLVAINVYSLFSIKNVIDSSLNSSLEQFEAMKVWWKENFELLKKIMTNDKQKAQYKQQFEAMLWQLDKQDANPTDSEAAEKEAKKNGWTLTQEKISQVVNWYEYGASNGEIAIIEYSDIECPFCRRHHNNGTLDKVVEKFPGKVKVLFKHFPLWFHKDAQKWWEALECIGEQLWQEWFYNYLQKAYASGYTSIEDLTKLAWEIGANVQNFTQCVNSDKYAQKVKDQMAQWQNLFKVSWTPWNIVLNLKTGKRVIVSWAYPVSEFESKIKELTE